VWGKGRIINEQSSFKQHQQQKYLNLSVKQHHKHNQSNQDKKEKKKNTPISIYPVWKILSYI